MGTPFPYHYTKLGTKPTASPEEIRRAFRAAVKRLPPTDASERWREILEAYAVLRDPIARRRYDACRRGRVWGRQIASRLPSLRGSPSRLRLMLWLGLATSSWVIHRLSARRNRDGKTPPERRPLALAAFAQNHRSTAVVLMDAFVGEVHRLMATQAPPEELAHDLSALLANYRSTAACHLRGLEPVTLRTNGPCEDGDVDALALMLIWGAQREVARTDRQASRDEDRGENRSRASF